VAAVGVAADLGAACAGEEIEVAARVGLLDMLGVKPGPAPRGGPRRRGPRGAAGRELVVWDVEGKRAVRDVERDPVAGADQGQGAADRRLWCHVQEHGAICGAGHPAVANPHDIADAALEQLGGERDVGGLRHAGVALRPAVADDQDRVLVNL